MVFPFPLKENQFTTFYSWDLHALGGNLRAHMDMQHTYIHMFYMFSGLLKPNRV